MPKRFKNNREYYIQRVIEEASKGLTRTQIAHNLGIAVSTLFDWINDYPEFHEALKKGEELAISKVENALFKRAVGYEYDEIKQYITIDKKGNKVKKVEKITKHVPPDVGAIIFYLKNRAPDRWKDKQDFDFTFDKTKNIRIEFIDTSKKKVKKQDEKEPKVENNDEATE